MTKHGILIAMAVFDTTENKRTDYTRRTLASLLDTVNFHKHGLFISDNGSCDETQKLYGEFINSFSDKFDRDNLYISLNGENLGTARAVNKAIKIREKGQHVIKMDNDVVIYQSGWVDRLVEVIDIDPKVGIAALKRKDLAQHPDQNHEDHRNPSFKSEIRMLPHKKGEPWIIIEEADDILGSCTLFNSALLDKIGYMFQISPFYGYDDTDFSVRSKMAGFKNCFIPYINIEHIDTGGTEFTQWKRDHAAEVGEKYRECIEDYKSGLRDIYFDGDFENDKLNKKPAEEHFRLDTSKPKSKLTLITTSSDENHPGWLKFKKSLDHFGWDYHLIVHEYKGFNSKIVAFYDFLKENKDKYPHFVYADAWDCFCLSTPQEVEDKFKNWDGIMIGPERACWPYGDWAPLFPESPYPHKYVNGGLFMGSSEKFIKMYERSPIMESGWDNDQIWSQDNFLRKNEDGMITLDRDCSIFQCIGHMNENDFAGLCISGQNRIMNLHTKTLGVFYHGNGGTPLNWIYDLLPEE